MKEVKYVVSNNYQLLKHDVKKFLKGLCYAALGAGAAWALKYFEAVDFGDYQVFAGAAISSATHLLHKWVGFTEYKELP